VAVIPHSLPDARLVARCRAGEQEAWSELVERYSRYVFAIATQAFRLEPHDAEDVFQDVFARTYEHLHRLRNDEAIRPWISQLTRRACIDRLRLRQGDARRAERLDPPAADDTLALLDEALSLRAALPLLDERCAEILDRFFARDQSYAEIGGDLGLPHGTVASRISRCLAKLRVLLEGSKPSGAASGERWRD
jgi:RNA polymerase sigma-70 factor (ECF subfamily)